MLTPAMQGIILAIAKARHTFDTEGPEAGLIKVDVFLPGCTIFTCVKKFCSVVLINQLMLL